MENKSIFSFLKHEKEFKEVYIFCIYLEKAIANEIYSPSLNISHLIIEFLLKIIITKNKVDNDISKKFYKKKNKNKHYSLNLLDNRLKNFWIVA